MCRSLDKVVAKFMSYLQASSLAENNGNMRIQIFEFSELNSTGAKLGILTFASRSAAATTNKAAAAAVGGNSLRARAAVAAAVLSLVPIGGDFTKILLWLSGDIYGFLWLFMAFTQKYGFLWNSHQTHDFRVPGIS
jgi:hypothetical protein